MIQLSASVSSDVFVRSIEWETVSEATLRYSCFLGDIEFVVNGVDFGTDWGWVPVLDFALALWDAISALSPTEVAVVGFTESDDWIQFVQTGASVSVTASYMVGSATAEMGELRRAAASFLGRVVEQVECTQPGLLVNESFGRIRDVANEASSYRGDTVSGTSM